MIRLQVRITKLKSISLSGLHKKIAVHLSWTTDLLKQTLLIDI